MKQRSDSILQFPLQLMINLVANLVEYSWPLKISYIQTLGFSILDLSDPSSNNFWRNLFETLALYPK